MNVERPRVAKWLALCKAEYGHLMEASDPTLQIDGWLALLQAKEISPQEMDEAMQNWLTTEHYPPRVADVIEHALAARKRHQEEARYQAWRDAGRPVVIGGETISLDKEEQLAELEAGEPVMKELPRNFIRRLPRGTDNE